MEKNINVSKSTDETKQNFTGGPKAASKIYFYSLIQ